VLASGRRHHAKVGWWCNEPHGALSSSEGITRKGTTESLAMSDVKWQPLWKRRFNLPPGVATLLGVALGWALAIVCAFSPPRDFSYSFLLILLLSLGFFGGIFGYILWLIGDPVREARRGESRAS
jgi:hypothetical protein